MDLISTNYRILTSTLLNLLPYEEEKGKETLTHLEATKLVRLAPPLWFRQQISRLTIPQTSKLSAWCRSSESTLLASLFYTSPFSACGFLDSFGHRHCHRVSTRTRESVREWRWVGNRVWSPWVKVKISQHWSAFPQGQNYQFRVSFSAGGSERRFNQTHVTIVELG